MFDGRWARLRIVSAATTVALSFGNRPACRGNGCSSHLAKVPSSASIVLEDGGRSLVSASTPTHSCFYSTAYWKRPFEAKMADKQWLGADLIFDLDGDHLRGLRPGLPGDARLIQEQAWTLWSDFWNQNLVQRGPPHVTFSGHRGFHLHYRDPTSSTLTRMHAGNSWRTSRRRR